MDSLAGKLNAVRFLVHGGRFNMSEFYKHQVVSGRGVEVTVTTLLRE